MAMGGWTTVEIYADSVRITAQIALAVPERLSDSVNRTGDFLQLRGARWEPRGVVHPVLSRAEKHATLAKTAAVLICPMEGHPPGPRALWRRKIAQPAAINTNAFSLVADIHVDPHHGLQDHLERQTGEFIPVTNVAALWMGSDASAPETLHRPFALLNPRSIVTFALRD